MKDNRICDNCHQAGKRKWVYFEEPVPIETFTYKTLSEVIISFEKAIPKDIQVESIKLIIFLRTGSEINTTFRTRIRVLNGDE
jgi:hypothetical protein